MSKHIDAELGLAYLEGRLDAARRAKLERHLAECDTCRAQLHQHQAAHSMLQTAGREFQSSPVEVPSWTAVRKRYQRRERTQTAVRTTLQFAAVGAMIALFIVFVIWYRPGVVEIEPPASPRPLLTNTPGATPTSETQVTPAPTAVLPASVAPVEEIISGAAETPVTITTPITPLATISPGLPVSQAFVSSQGQVAFVQEGRLFVETADHAFVEVAQVGEPPVGEDGPVENQVIAWSPDGRSLAFFYAPVDGELVEVGIWEAGTVTPLSQLVNRLLPAVPFTSYRWSPDGNQLLLTTSSRLEPASEWTSGVWVAHLDTGELTLVVEARELVDITWLEVDRFFLRLDCGVDCAILMAYNEQREQLWKAYEEEGHAAGLFDLSADGKRLVNLNTVDRTVDVLDTTTGEIVPIWSIPNGTDFASMPPSFSPDGKVVALTLNQGDSAVLHLVGLEGQVYGWRENSTLLDWRTGGGLVVAEAVNDEENQLVYWGLDSSIARMFVRPKHFRFDGGAWSEDGRYFVYSAVDESIGASYLYLWQPESGVPFLIHAAASGLAFDQFTWRPNGTGFYFNLNREGLWFYDVVSGEVLEIGD